MADTVVPGPGVRGRQETPEEAQGLLGQTIDGRFRVEEMLARGGMGFVYRARELPEEREVALKVLHPALCTDEGLVERFLQEARAASSIGHPAIVEVLGAGAIRRGGPVYYAMEYLHGEDLSHILKRQKRLSWRRTRAIALQVVQGLQASHSAGIIHRDLKPANFFVIPEKVGERLKILDFGIAKISESSSVEAVVQTHGGSVFGTPAYMAPEQASGETVDERTDVYAVAACIYEFLTGDPPYSGANFMQVLSRVLTQPLLAPSIRSPDNVPPEVEALILTGMAKEPADRYQSMAELGAALLGIDPECRPQITDPGVSLASSVLSIQPPVDAIPDPPPFDIDASTGSAPGEIVMETRPPLPFDGAATHVRVTPPESADRTLVATPENPPGKAPRDELLTPGEEKTEVSKGSFVGRLDDMEGVDPEGPPPVKTGDTLIMGLSSAVSRDPSDQFTKRENTQVTPLHQLPGRQKLEYSATAVAEAAREVHEEEPSNPGAIPPTLPSPGPVVTRPQTPPLDSEPTTVAEILDEIDRDNPRPPRRGSAGRVVGWMFAAIACIGLGAAAMLFGPQLLQGSASETATADATDEPVKAAAVAPADPAPPTEAAAKTPAGEDAPEPDDKAADADDDQANEPPAEAADPEAPDGEAAQNTEADDADGPTSADADETEPAVEPVAPRRKAAKRRRGRKTSRRETPQREPQGPPDALGRAEISGGFHTASSRIEAKCGKHGGARVRVQVTVSSSGHVTSAMPLSAPDDGLGRCVASAVRSSARFPEFKKAQDTFLWTYQL